MNEITLKINLDEANLILESLGNLPFNRVYTLVAKVQAQASEQLEDGKTQINQATETQSDQEN